MHFSFKKIRSKVKRRRWSVFYDNVDKVALESLTVYKLKQSVKAQSLSKATHGHFGDFKAWFTNSHLPYSTLFKKVFTIVQYILTWRWWSKCVEVAKCWGAKKLIVQIAYSQVPLSHSSSLFLAIDQLSKSICLSRASLAAQLITEAEMNMQKGN